MRISHWVLLCAAVAVASTVPTSAHEIPSEVTVQTWVKPAGRRMVVLVRAPLNAMRDMDVPRRPDGFLDLARVDPVLRDAAVLWIGDAVRVYEGDRRLGAPEVLAARVSLPSDRSFQESYDRALAHVTGPPLDPGTQLYWEQGLLDVAFAYDIDSDQSEFAISPGLTRLGMRVNVVLRFLPPGGSERVFDLHGDPGIVKLDPRWHQAAFRFVKDGFFHILDGVDHLLFLLCLVIPFRQFVPLVAVVTSFTVAHSITLIASAVGVAPGALWFPALVETLIAVSIVYMALENIATPALQRRWLITFAFGLVHGFGFSFALRESLQLAGRHVLTSLLAFNVGVELGQLLVLLLLIPALDLLFRYGIRERIGTIILSAFVAHTGWHWTLERGAALSQYRFEWPAVDALLLAAAIRWLMLLLITGAALWLLRGLLRLARRSSSEGGRPLRRNPESETT